MSDDAPTYVVRLTPQGRAAVASVLVVGTKAVAAVDARFQSAAGLPLARLPEERIAFGRWQSATAVEEVVVCRRDERRVEVHGHGGAAAVSAIIDSLVSQGCRELSWQDWLRQSSDDPLRAAAEIALAAAPTERTAAVLWDQRQGALGRACDEIIRRLQSGDSGGALSLIDALLCFAPLGLHLVEPWQVVLAGRPNVGKSSLVNRLAGFERAIVHSTPGTTRDIVSTPTAIDGWPVELSDTAGLRPSDDPLEAAGIDLARRRLASADLVVLVFDATAPEAADDQSPMREWPGALSVTNKSDLLPADARFAHPGLLVSAVTGAGMDQLYREISRRLVPVAPPPGAAVPFLPEQVQALTRARQAVAAGQFTTARDVLANRQNWAASL